MTIEQKRFLQKKKLVVDDWYMFPQYGFTIYDEPHGNKEYIDVNPHTKRLNAYFKLKEIKGEFVRGNFLEDPAPKDFWMRKDVFENRGFFVTAFLVLLCFIPFTIYNLFQTPEIKEKEVVVNLGKKTIGYYIKLMILTPLYFLMAGDKTFVEFKNGLISHTCEWVKFTKELNILIGELANTLVAILYIQKIAILIKQRKNNGDWMTLNTKN
jgi:hypothetical protein